MSLAESLGLSNADYGLVGTDTKAFLGGSNRFHNFVVDRPVRYVAKIGEVEVECASTLRGAKLTRLSLLERPRNDGNGTYYLINGTMRHVRIDNSVVIDSKEYTLAQVFCELVNSGIEDENAHVSLDRFLEIVGRNGFDIDNRNNGMGLNFVHFGADINKVNEIFTWFEEHGATDLISTIATPGDIKRVYGFDQGQDGIEISEFRTGTMNRSMTQNGNGFISFADAAFGNFDRFVKHRAKARAMRLELEKAMESDKKPNDAAIEEANKRIAIESGLATEWMGTWGGVSRRVSVNPQDGSKTLVDKYDTVQVPIGTLVAADGKTIDFWSNSNSSTQATSSSSNVDLTKAEPF